MIKKIKTKAFKDRLRGHKDGIITLYSPDGPQSGMLLSASKDGCIRGKYNQKFINKIQLLQS